MAASERAWDEQRSKRARVATLQDQMKRHDIGALLLGGGIGVRYLLGVAVPASKVFVPAHGEPIGFIRQRDIEYVRPHHAAVRLALYEQEVSNDCRDLDRNGRMACTVADLMEQHGVAGERLGVEVAAPGLLIGLIKRGVDVVDARDVFERAMAIKNDDEIMMYRAIADQYVDTMRAFREASVPGATENAIAGAVVTAWHEAGGEEVSQLNVCSGENMNPWRRWPTERVLKSGDFVGIDLHARGVNGLRGDVSRTYFVGDRPTPEQRALYREAYQYVQEAIPIFRVGRTFAEIAEATPPVPASYQRQQFSYHIAHGVGMGSSGYPHIEPQNRDSDSVLAPNQLLAIECHFGEPGSALAVKLEDMIVVRDGPPEVLTSGVPFDERLIG
ncbi:MAG: M24 family metallopeptidase [Chloroflexi bacterium]|nr:M24 family metallopeptidase [Chloroflexota bacterium]